MVVCDGSKATLEVRCHEPPHVLVAAKAVSEDHGLAVDLALYRHVVAFPDRHETIVPVAGM